MSAPSAVSVPSSKASEDFSTFITNFRAQLRDTFRRRGDIDAMSLERGLPPYVLRDVRSCKPLSAFIPSAYGGRGGHVHESLSVLQAAGYESIALTLTLGINGALFIQPVSKYAKDEVKGPIFKRFLEHQHMGGLMITEPDYGSDALSMQTGYTEHEEYAHVQGMKHWAGLTGWADFWLLTARKQDADGNLARDIDIFICDITDPESAKRAMATTIDRFGALPNQARSGSIPSSSASSTTLISQPSNVGIFTVDERDNNRVSQDWRSAINTA